LEFQVPKNLTFLLVVYTDIFNGILQKFNFANVYAGGNDITLKNLNKINTSFAVLFIFVCFARKYNLFIH